MVYAPTKIMQWLTEIDDNNWKPPVPEVPAIPVSHEPSVPEVCFESSIHVMEVDELVGVGSRVNH